MARDIREEFTAALDALIDEVKKDRSVLAAILCGSLSHDTVWARSDIDLLLITVDDRKIVSSDLALYADGINVHANLIPRAQFRKAIEGSLRNSFIHSLISKGRVLYSHDPTVADLASAAIEFGERDTQLQLLAAATGALPAIYKAHKWFITRGDLDYTALWILYAATPLARIEVVGRRLLADREVIPQAALLNPAFFRIIYTDLLNVKKTRPRIEAALEAIDGYIETRTGELFAPVLDYLSERGDVRTASEIEMHFTRDHGIGGVTTACEYLADRGIIGKVSAPVHLTKRSNIEVQELAFVDIGGTPDSDALRPRRKR